MNAKAAILLIAFTVFSLAGGAVAAAGLFILIEDRFGTTPSAIASLIVGGFTWGTLIVAYLKE